jgi:methyl-accepting chemotaxis protein
MDDVTQQNAALVEETTSAAQSMREQARELMRQVEVFKIREREASYVKREASGTGKDVKREASESGDEIRFTRPASRPLDASRFTRPASRTARHAGEPAGVAAGRNGKDHHWMEKEFEEF